jgi:protocatechuate 3,4-dioxygenase beta subunit
VLLLLGVMGAVGFAEQSASPGVGQISFTGKTLDSQGQPVADANVVLHVVTYGGGREYPVAERIGNVVTGPDGAFAFTAPKEGDTYRQGSIIAQKQGLALGWAVWELRDGNQQSDIKLSEPREIGGVVVDEGDSPIVDADVSVAIAILGAESDRRYLTYFVAPKLLTVKTDSAGRFVFANMPAEATCEFLAKKPGRATVCSFDPRDYRGEKCHFSPGQAGIKLTLPVEARLEGKVVEKAGGKPVAGMSLTAEPDQRGLPFMVEPFTSAADGSFSVGGLSAGGYTVRLSLGLKTADWVAEPMKLNLKAGETVRDVQLSLSKGGLLEVLVKEDRSQKPVEKASISLRYAAQDQWLSGVTDANGIARIRLVAGDYRLGGIYKEEYTRQDQEKPFTIVEGQTTRMEETLGGLPTVSGVVYDDAGKPLEGATVKILPGGRGKNAVSDADGKFQVLYDTQGWPSGQTVFFMIARHPGRNLAAAQPVDDAGAKMEVKLQPAATLAGRVMDPNGKPIQGAYLQVMLRESNWGSSFLSSRSVVSNAQGEFEAPTLPAGHRYSVTASAEGYGQARIETTEDQMTAGKVQAGPFTLPLANMSVTGVVVDSAGKPVSGARISCFGGSQDNQPNRDAKVDAEGRFTLDRVCPGRISISADAQVEGVNLNGYVQTEGGASNVQIVVSERSSSRRYVPRKPASLMGKRLPDLKKLGIELPADANDRMLLVCFWDLNQRPSRHCIGQLAQQAAQLGEKGVTLVAVQAGQTEQTALDQWMQQNKPSFPVGCLKENIEETKFEWGAASLPHLILTDKKHIVIAEGFGLLGELDKRIDAASSQPGQ